jgi:hypothetical protein
LVPGFAKYKKAFESSHFDEPNILAHIRTKDRIDGSGKKTLFVEEIQSDWHQAGRDKGYKSLKNEKDLISERKKIEENLDDLREKRNKLGMLLDDLLDGKRRDEVKEEILTIEKELKSVFDKISDLNKRRNDLTDEIIKSKIGVPDAPFKKTWHEYSFKNILKDAAENNYDNVAWTTGEQQAQRYDLSKQIGSLEITKNTDGSFGLTAFKDEAAHGRGRNPLIEETHISRDELSDLIGRELVDRADKEIDLSTGINYKEFKGLDLKIGGEGMRGFYDKMLVDYANKIGKRYGVKVTKGDVVTLKKPTIEDYHIFIDQDGRWYVSNRDGERMTQTFMNLEDATTARDKLLNNKFKNTENVHSFKITPEMRKDILEKGFPLFTVPAAIRLKAMEKD